MKVETTELNPCTVEMKFACTSDQVQTAYDKAIRKAAKRVRVPGFRPEPLPSTSRSNTSTPKKCKGSPRKT